MNRFVMMCCALAALSSCSKSPELEDEHSVVGSDFTTTISIGESTKVDCSYGNEVWKFTWEKDDPVYALKSGSTAITMTQTSVDDEGKEAEYSCSGFDTDVSYALLYSDEVPTISGTQVAVDLTAQDGQLSDIMMISEYKGDWGSGVATPELKHVGSFMVLDFKFTLPEYLVDLAVEKIVVKGFNSKCNIDFSKRVDDADFYTNKGKDDITITPAAPLVADVKSDGSATIEPIYINILPSELGASETITATVYFTNSTSLDFNFGGSAALAFDRAEFNSARGKKMINRENLRFYFENESGNIVEFDKSATAGKSYSISTPGQLYGLALLANCGQLDVADNVINQFTLKGDIKLDSDKFWVPIGYRDNSVTGNEDIRFIGVFDGGGHSVKGYRSSSHGGTYGSIGLFGYVAGASSVVKNLILDNCHSELVHGEMGTHVGILAGTLELGAKLLNCGCNSNCTAKQRYSGAIGGLVGLTRSDAASGYCEIINCYNQGSVKSECEDTETKNDVAVGGLCGYGQKTNFTNCYNSGDVIYVRNNFSSDTDFFRGALVGNNSSVVLTNCYYRTGCAGVGVKAKGYLSGGGSADGGATPESEAELKSLATALTTNTSSITGAKTWTAVTDSYPTLDFNP